MILQGKDRVMRAVGAILAAMLIALAALTVSGFATRSPENPIAPSHEPLIAETATAHYEGGEGTATVFSDTVEYYQNNKDADPAENPPEEPPESDGAESGARDEKALPDVDDEEIAIGDEAEEESDEPGSGNAREPGSGDSGDGDGTSGGESGSGPGNGGESGEGPGSESGGESSSEPPAQFAIVTNLDNYTGRQVSQTELTGDVLHFYAYTVGGGENATLTVRYRHASQSGNGTVLAGTRNYARKLQLGKNYFTLYAQSEDGQTLTRSYLVNYQAAMADEQAPTVGEHPPTIETNFDGRTEPVKTNDFLFKVKATKYDGTPIYSNAIKVTLDGKTYGPDSGNRTYEYNLHVDDPNFGDEQEHTITVLAWDDEGNSAFRTITFTFQNVGGVIGNARVIFDATVIGLGILDEGEYEITKGETAASVVLRMLEEFGYEVNYRGGTGQGFYLAGISRGNVAHGAVVPEELRACIDADGIKWNNLTYKETIKKQPRDSISEFDLTTGSGWMYEVDGKYPGRAMGAYPLEDGMTVVVRFTLADGKDIGGYETQGRPSGHLSKYCYFWIDGEQIDQDRHDYTVKERVEPVVTDTELTDGYILYECSVCGHTYKEILKAEPPESEPESGPEPESGSEPADEPGSGGE